MLRHPHDKEAQAALLPRWICPACPIETGDVFDDEGTFKVHLDRHHAGLEIHVPTLIQTQIRTQGQLMDCPVCNTATGSSTVKNLLHHVAACMESGAIEALRPLIESTALLKPAAPLMAKSRSTGHHEEVVPDFPALSKLGQWCSDKSESTMSWTFKENLSRLRQVLSELPATAVGNMQPPWSASTPALRAADTATGPPPLASVSLESVPSSKPAGDSSRLSSSPPPSNALFRLMLSRWMVEPEAFKALLIGMPAHVITMAYRGLTQHSSEGQRTEYLHLHLDQPSVAGNQTNYVG